MNIPTYYTFLSTSLDQLKSILHCCFNSLQGWIRLLQSCVLVIPQEKNVTSVFQFLGVQGKRGLFQTCYKHIY